MGLVFLGIYGACVGLVFLVSQVAEYAVDSLKQLALKFVCKEELRDFNFQRLFLCPFESVFVATQHKDIKVLILDCLQNLVQVRVGEGGLWERRSCLLRLFFSLVFGLASSLCIAVTRPTRLRQWRPVAVC